jgi:hypothetical protein
MFHNKAVASLMLLILLSSTFIGGITFTVQKSYAQEEVQQPETPTAAPPCDPNTPDSCPPPAPTENATETSTEQPAAPTEQPAAPTEAPTPTPTENVTETPTETPSTASTENTQTNTVPSSGTLITNTGCDPSKSSCLPIDVRYDVPLVPQLTNMSCWAAGAAMLVGWRDRVSINPSEIAKGIGYWSQYNKNGLDANDTTMFQYWGLTPEAPQSYTVEGFAHLLKDNGPLWVASAEPGPHIRVVTGMSGDGTPDGTTVYINDPLQIGMTKFSMPNSGSQYTETYHQFQDKQDSLAMTELKTPGALYVAHVNVPHLP